MTRALLGQARDALAAHSTTATEKGRLVEAITAALAQPEQEIFGWHFQHDETGRTTFVDQFQLDNGWEDLNPRWNKVATIYAAPPAPEQYREPAGWRDFIVKMSMADGGTVSGNYLSRVSKELLAAAPPAPDSDQQQLLIEVIAAHHKLYFENETLRRDLADMTAQRDQLRKVLAAMTVERDQLRIHLADMTAQRDRLAMRYDALEARSDGDRMDARRWRRWADVYATGYEHWPTAVQDAFTFEQFTAAIDAAMGDTK